MNLRKKVLDTYGTVCRMAFGMNRKTVLFQSFHGKQYSDNPKAISEALHNIAPDIDIAWLLNDCSKKEVPDYVRVIDNKNRLMYYRELVRAAVIVNNFSLPAIKKNEKQLFIQTWHGDKAFKKILYDSDHFTEEQRPTEAIAGYCDIAVAGSEYGIMQYRSAFRYTGEVLCEGTPRNDILVNITDDKINEIKKKLNIENTARILLYAPTLRRGATLKNEEQDVQDIDIERTLASLEEKYNCKWVCFVRAHAAVKGLGGIKYSEKIIDVSGVEDMADLLAISDMLITDYSSCAGDFALLGRPIVLFQSDREKYLEEDRELYFKMEDSPYYVAFNQQELEDLIYGFEKDAIKKNCRDILDFYKTNETGRASESVAEIIKKHIDKLKNNK